jgi:MFS family permease
MAFIDGTVVNVALPEIQARLGATAVDAQRIVESYALLLAALILVGGSLGDHYGRRRIFALGIVLFAASLVWCGLAGSAFLPFVVITFILSRWAGGLVGRYGAKLPLVIGPTIAAAGFVLFALPGTGGSYWTTFFPAIVVMGLGMALVIAPLTTTAMNSVSGRHSGLASGVNNAVSRTGSLLAIPVLGIFVFTTFSGGLDARTAELDLPQAARQQLEAENVDLGGAEVLDGGTATAVERAVDEAFVASFRIAMLVAAGLGLASAVAAGILIEGQGQAVRSGVTERVGSETAPA